MRPTPASIPGFLWLPLAFAGACLPALAGASVTITFRDGLSPSASYAGTTATRIYDGADAVWNPNANYEGKDLEVDSSPAFKAVLMRWDLSPIPAGVTITAVSLTLNIDNDSNDSYSIYECLKPWVDDQATWNQYATGAAWTLPGAGAVAPAASPDRDGTVLNLDPLTGSTGLRTFALNSAGVAVVQKWLNTPSTNMGFVIPPGTNTDGIGWDDAEDSTLANRPRLNITYSGGPGSKVTLQNGVGNYTGTTDTLIANGPDPRTVNYSDQGLRLEGTNATWNTLIRFDVSSLPPWATVSSASLSFHVTSSTNQTFPVYQALQPWNESQATWNVFQSNSPWQVPGASGSGDSGKTVLGVFAPAQNGTQAIALGNAGVQLVQDWVRGNQANNGFILTNPTATDDAQMDDQEDSTPADRPGLTVTYTEGRLAVSAPASIPVGSPATLTVQRQRLDGVPIAAGAPSLDVTLSSNAPTGLFASSPGTGWTPTLQVTVPPGASVSAPFYYQDSNAGQPTLSAGAGPAWNAASQLLAIVATPDAGPAPDAGGPGDAGGTADGGQTDGGHASPPLDLAVGCGCGSTGSPAALLLGLLVLLALARRLPGR